MAKQIFSETYGGISSVGRARILSVVAVCLTQVNAVDHRYFGLLNPRSGVRVPHVSQNEFYKKLCIEPMLRVGQGLVCKTRYTGSSPVRLS